jgi:two-component system cell cycle sensor histidine kinase/response regulator CckA
LALANPPTRLEDLSRRVSRVCAAVTIAVGALVLAGWAFEIPLLTRFWPGFAPMAPNTALSFLLIGIALWPLAGCEPPRRRRALAAGIGIFVALVGASTLTEYLTHRSFGIDQMLFRDPLRSVQTAATGRMTEATAIALLLLGVAVALLAIRRAHRTAQGLCLLAFGLALVAFVGHLYDVRALHETGAFSGIAFGTVLTLFVAAISLLGADPDHGVTALLTSGSVGGAMARRILPFAIVIPIVLGGLERLGRVAGLYPSEFGVAILVVASVVLIGIVVVHQSLALGHIDRERVEATGAASYAVEMLRKLSRAVEQSPASVVITDTKGDIEYVNPKFTAVTGYSLNEVLGMNPRILKSGELSPDVYRELWETITAGREWRGEFHNRRKDGGLFWERASISPVFDEARKITNFVAVKEDITERKLAQEALAAKESHFRSLIENAQDVITIIDAGGTIRFQSPAAERILGRPPGEFVGRNILEFLHPDDAPGVQETLRRGIESPEAPRKSTFRFRHANGSWRSLEAVGKLLPGEGIPEVVVNSRDVTESRALEEQLRQAQKMEAIGRLAGGIAHDFNNLLTVITGYTALAAARLNPDGPPQPELVEIEKAAQRATDLTRQLLAFSRKQVLQPRVVNLNRLVGDTERMLRRVIGEEIELVTSLAEPLGSVKADMGQIVQVLLNLAVNARDAMPKGGKLAIETSEIDLDPSYTAFHFDVPAGRYVRLAVSDTGTGMDAKTLSHAFEPFFTTKEAGKGTGLGLSTVYGIVKQSGGHVSVYSEPAMGTTFKIYLPLVNEAPEGRAASPSSALQAGGTETILIVEDEEAVRRLICRSLDARGFKTLPADGGSAALLVCEQYDGEIHLMLTDVVMPQMRGTELARRAAPLRPGMKVLFMSGYTDDAIVQSGVLDPGTSFLQKPFTPRSLAAKVREVLDEGAE